MQREGDDARKGGDTRRRGWCLEGRGQCKKKGLVPGGGRCDGSCSLFRLFLELGLSRRVSKSPNCANVFTCLLRAQAGLIH